MIGMYSKLKINVKLMEVLKMSNENSVSGGISFLGLLTIVFIVLKLTGYINWSWFWVLSPMIFSFILVILIVLIGAIYLLFKTR